MKKLNITFCSFPDFSSNAKPLYEYMKKKYGEKINYTWIVYNESSVKKLKNKGINAILIGTNEFEKYIKKTDVFFTTQGNLDGDKTKKSIYVELWHGIGPKKNGYFSKNPSKEDITGYDHMRKIFDYIIAPNDFWRTIYSAKFNVEYSRTVGLGMPKLDYFKNSNGRKNISKVLNIDCSKYKKIIIYMPTFKKGFNHKDTTTTNVNNIFNFQKYKEKELIEYLEKNNFLLCIKRHPGDKLKYSTVESNNIKNINDEMLLKNEISVNEIINGFDMLITDYSSIGVEFLFFNRPILYAINDIGEYEENRGLLFENNDFWLIGPKVRKIEDFFFETDKLLNDPNYYSVERTNARKLLFQNIKDGGCDKICNYFFNEDGSLKSNIKQYHSVEIAQKKEIEKLSLYNKELKKELSNIVNSKAWKLAEKLRKFKHKIFK